MSSNKKKIWLSLVFIALLSVGGFYAYQNFNQTEESADAPTMQTAKVRQGDLTLYASGTGTLTSAREATFGFRSGGQLLSLSVSVGDAVEAGQLLGEIDSASEEVKLKQAERALRELTSPTAIEIAAKDLALSEKDVLDARNALTYVISPALLYREEQVAEFQEALLVAQAEAEANPSDEADAKIAEIQSDLERAELNLRNEQYSYENEYIPEYFTVPATRTEEAYISPPSEVSITEARANYSLAKVLLVDAENYLAVLKGEEIPENATGSKLTKLEQAQLDVISAQENLDATRLYAPIAGTVMSINVQIGDTVNTSPIITIADTSESYLEIFLDETDWGMISLGYPVEVTFDIFAEKTFSGEVVQVDPALYTTQNSSLVRGIVRLNDANLNGSKPPIGSAAAVEVIGGHAEGAILVPVEALREASPGQFTVFVLVDGEPKLRVVEVGLQDLFYAEILSGLEVGDVVTTGIAETE